MHFVERKISVLKCFLYYIMYLAEVLIFLTLMRMQANGQSLCKPRTDPFMLSLHCSCSFFSLKFQHVVFL